MNRLIGLSGYARAGKDTIATILADYGYVRVGFADSLRDVALALDPLIFMPGVTTRCRPLTAVIDEFGWEQAKDLFPEVRRTLQRIGTEVGRKFFGENVWVDMGLAKVTGPTVFTDCRFPNEAAAIRKAGGQVWRVHRHGYGPVNNHPSETALDGYDFDWHVWNNGTLTELATTIRSELFAPTEAELDRLPVTRWTEQ